MDRLATGQNVLRMPASTLSLAEHGACAFRHGSQGTERASDGRALWRIQVSWPITAVAADIRRPGGRERGLRAEVPETS